MGIYQLCYLKMHSGMLFLAGHTEDKEKETLLKALSDVQSEHLLLKVASLK